MRVTGGGGGASEGKTLMEKSHRKGEHFYLLLELSLSETFMNTFALEFIG